MAAANASLGVRPQIGWGSFGVFTHDVIGENVFFTVNFIVPVFFGYGFRLVSEF